MPSSMPWSEVAALLKPWNSHSFISLLFLSAIGDMYSEAAYSPACSYNVQQMPCHSAYDARYINMMPPIRQTRNPHIVGGTGLHLLLKPPRSSRTMKIKRSGAINSRRI
jgi:hypothetical protein